LGVLARLCKSKFWEISIDRLRAKFDRSILSSIDRVLQNFRIFQAILHEFCHSSLINLQNIKTQKLTKALENNKAKGLTNVNQGVQIHNIWHSSRGLVMEAFNAILERRLQLTVRTLGQAVRTPSSIFSFNFFSNL
jgi:triphosphoribosyl-dephospho-CoA synthetase